MNGKSPPWNTPKDHSRGGVNGNNPPQESQGLDLHYGEKSRNVSHSSSPPLSGQKNQDLEKGNWTSVIEEASEMSNGAAVEQDLSCKTSVAYEDPHSGTRETDPVGSVDEKWTNGQEKDKLEERKRNQDSPVKRSPVGHNRDVQLMEVKSLTDVSSENEKILKRGASRTLEQFDVTGLSSLEPHVSAEQKEDSGITDKSSILDTIPVRSHGEEIRSHSESLVKCTSRISSTSSDIKGNKEVTSSLTAPLLRAKPKEDAKAYEDVNPGRCVDSLTKLCEDYCSKAKIAIIHTPGVRGSAEPTSVCSSTSVSNICKDISSSPTLKSSESAVKCDATSNLPHKQDVSLKTTTSNVEHTPAKEASSTCNTENTICSDDQSPQKEVKQEMKPNNDDCIDSTENNDVCSPHLPHSVLCEAQEDSQDSTVFEKLDLQANQESKSKLGRSPGKEMVPHPDSIKKSQKATPTPSATSRNASIIQKPARRRKALESSEAIHGQSQKQKITCKRKERTDDHSKTNLGSSSLINKGVCPTSNVSQCPTESNEDVESVNASNKAKSNMNIPTEVHTNACSVQNTLKKPGKCRRKTLKKLKKNIIGFTVAQTNLQDSDVPQEMVQKPDLEDLTTSKTPNERSCEQKGKAVKENKVKRKNKKHNSRKTDTCLSPDNTSPTELHNTLQPVSDIKTEPEEDEEEPKDYLRKLRHRSESASPKQLKKNVKVDPDTLLPHVPVKGHSTELEQVEHEQTIDRLKMTKACTKKRKRSGRSFKKRKQRKVTTLFSAVLETQNCSENKTAQDLQEISQSDGPGDLETMDVKSEAETEASVNFSRKSSVSLVSPDPCKDSPEHELTVVSSSVATVDTVEAGNLTSDVFKGALKKSPGKPPRKLRKRTQSGASEVHTALPIKPEKRQCRKTTRLENATADGMESAISEHKISKPQGPHTPSKKKGKKSKLQVQHVQCTKWNMRHCRRSSRFTVGSVVKRLRKHDGAATDDTISSNRQSDLSQAVHEKGAIKPQELKQNIKRKTGKKKSNTPLPENSCDVTEISKLKAAQEGKGKKTSGDCSLVRRSLQMSKENDTQVATLHACISPRRRKLNPDVITCDQALVKDAEPLEDGSSAEIPQVECGQMRQDLKQTPVEAECEYGGTPGVKTKSKTKRKMSEQNARPASKRKTASRQQATSLEQEQSTTDQLIICLQSPLKSEVPDKKDVKINADFDAGNNEVLLQQTAVEEVVHIALSTKVSTEVSQDKDIKEREFKAPWDKNERKTAFELALESFIMTTQFHTGENDYVICAKKVKEERSEKPVMESVEAEKKHSSALHDSKRNEKVKSLSSKESARKCIVCKYCGQYFRHISAYTVHQRIHTGEKPYRCKLCGKNFAQLSKLKFHQKSHTKTVSLCCPCCSKAFPNKNSLVAHFKIHLQEPEINSSLDQDVQCKPSIDPSHVGKPQKDRSLICKTGDKNVPNNCTVKNCMHEDPFPCKTCGKKFKKPSKLDNACSICTKGSNRLKAMKKHQLTKQCHEKGELNKDNSDCKGFLVTQQGVEGQVNTPVFFKCKICRQLFQKWCQYTLHLQTHTRFPPHLCFACGQSYENVSEVSVHCKVCCLSSGEEAACGASLSEIFDDCDLQNHSSSRKRSRLSPCSLQKSKSRFIALSDGSKSNESSRVQTPSSSLHPLQTSEVMDALSSSLHEMGHISEDVGHLPSAPSSPTPSVITCVSSNDSLECTEIAPSLWRFECPRCRQRFKRYRNLCAHIQTHAPEFRHVCGHCGQTFKRWNRLWLHQRIHGGKGRCYSCSQCSLRFRFFGSYKDHMLSHAGERPFACPVCPETFVCEDRLHAHQCEFHKASKILRCDVCAKTFSTLQNLLKHSRLHNGAVSHQCLSCKLSFTNNKILQEHLKMHSDSLGLPLPDIPSKPLSFSHKCKRCEASFSTGDLLYAHQACHFRRRAFSVHIDEPPSSTLREKPQTETAQLPSTTRPLISTLNLDAIPNDKSLYAYPHPDKLYTRPRLLRRIRLQIINLDSDNDEEEQVNPLPERTASPQALPNSSTPVSGRSLELMPESTQTSSEIDAANLPQGSEIPESTPAQSQPDDCTPADCTIVKENTVPNSKTRPSNFVETDVVIEELTTFSNSKEHEELDESFECPQCSYKTRSLLGLHEHYFLRALANGCLAP